MTLIPRAHESASAWPALVLLAVGTVALIAGVMAGDFTETMTNGASL